MTVRQPEDHPSSPAKEIAPEPTQDRSEDAPGHEPERHDQGPRTWVVVGIFGALGVEFVSVTIGAIIIGTWIDRRYDTEPYGVLVAVLLALVSIGWHIVLIMKRFLRDGD